MIDEDLQAVSDERFDAIDFVKICEVGPRDGLQNEATPISTDDKIRYIDMLSASGLAMIEVSSFVNPKAIPALADAEAVFGGIKKRAGVTYLALVPNARGFERALAAGVDAIAVFTAASETFTQKNIGMGIQESIDTFAPLVSEARRRGMFIRGYVSTAFGCPYEGAVPFKNVLAVSEQLAEMGIDELSIGDTIGVGEPDAVTELTEMLQAHIPYERLAMHFHDTRGRAIDNIVAAYAMGIRIFDSSSGGLGGCPYAPGASGNVATEKVLALFAERGIHTNVDSAAVAAATTFITSRIRAASS
jgi:hydroxymethylglutaryl-CoA lyase